VTKTVIGSLALVALAFVSVSAAQEKHPALSTKSPGLVQKSARASDAVADERNSAGAAGAPAASAKDGGSDAKTSKPPTAGTVEKPDMQPDPAAGDQGRGIVRDPFRPITVNLRATVRRRENLSPLERFEIAQLKLVGIVRNTKGTVALVEDNVGFGYTVTVGTPIGPNDGKIKMIKSDELLIEEEYIDLYGAKKKREVSMRLPVERSE
jgi:Tfp pilus assembly protein PilP